MVDASELEDFDMATNTKKLLEPLRIELDQLKITTGMQAEERPHARSIRRWYCR